MLRASVHLVVVVDQVPAGVGRDHDAVVGDVQEPVGRLDRHGFAGEVASDVIAVLEDADATGAVDAATDDLLSWCGFLFDRDVTIDHVELRRPRQLEAADRRHVAEGLMLPLVVVVGDPDLESSLHLFD